MSKIKIEKYFEVPKQIYPFDEVSDLCYQIGYFVGSSFRVICHCDDFDSAKRVLEDISVNKKEYVLLCVKINIQRYY